MFWICIGHVLAMRWPCFGHALGMFWTCSLLLWSRWSPLNNGSPTFHGGDNHCHGKVRQMGCSDVSGQRGAQPDPHNESNQVASYVRQALKRRRIDGQLQHKPHHMFGPQGTQGSCSTLQLIIISTIQIHYKAIPTQNLYVL